MISFSKKEINRLISYLYEMQGQSHRKVKLHDDEQRRTMPLVDMCPESMDFAFQPFDLEFMETM